MRDNPEQRSSDPTSAVDAFELPNRRPTYILNTPALIAHYVFWFSPTDPAWDQAVEHFQTCRKDYVARLREPGDLVGDPDPKLVIAAVVNTYLQRFAERSGEGENLRAPLFTRARKCNDATIRLQRTGKGEQDPDPSVAVDRTLAMAGVIEGFSFELTADIFREHFSLSFRLLPMAGAGRPDTESALGRARAILGDLVSPGPGKLERIRDRQADCDAPDEFTSRLESLKGLQAADAQANYWIRTLYDEIWSEFFGALDRNQTATDPNLPPSYDPSSFSDRSWFPARLAGVFRNIVIRTMPQNAQDDAQNEHPADGERFNMEGDRSFVLRNVPNGVLGHVNERSQLALDGFASRSITEPHRMIRARVTEHLNHRSVFFGRILGFRGNSRWIEDLQSGNATLSAMLDGLAIHGSTLGLHTTGDRQYPHQEVRHFVVYGGPSRQQLGRLCRELHAVGEYRLLALRGYRTLDEASRRINDIYDSLTEIDALLMDREPQEAILRLNDASYTLHRVKQSVPDGGLITRLLQPEVCLRHLRRHLETLRISRVEGWRPYDEFVTRSVEPHVSYLASIRGVLEELDEALRSFEARASTLRTGELTEQITEFVQDINDLTVLSTYQNTTVQGLGYIAAATGVLAAGIPLSIAGMTIQGASSVLNFGFFAFGLGFSVLGLAMLGFGLMLNLAAGRAAKKHQKLRAEKEAAADCD